MKLLLQNIKWDAYLIFKYGIAYVAFGITALYCVGFALSNTEGYEKAIAALIFTDPVMYGFLFTAIMVLFEKDANTHQVLAITPMPSSNYILSKAIVFTLLALVCSWAMILSAQPTVFNPVVFFFAVALSSTLFIFIGVIAISYVQSFNQFILTIPIVLAPVCLPFLNYFNWVHSPLFYLIPTQASLLLFEASFGTITIWKVFYALTFLLACNILCYKWAIKNFKHRILNTL